MVQDKKKSQASPTSKAIQLQNNEPTVGIEYASAHRRMLGALIDIIVIFLLLTPLNMVFDKFVFGDRNIFYLLDTYSNLHKDSDSIDVIDLISYLNEEGWVMKFLLMHLVTIACIGTYTIGFWTYKAATPGKMLARCVIVDDKTLQPIGVRKALLRFIGYIFSTLLLCLGFVMMHFAPRNRALHDYMAGTVVIIQQNGAKDGSV